MNKQQQKSKLITQKKEKKCAERYFFKYAFPCAQVKLKLGSITPEKYEKLKQIFLENSYPTKQELETTFPPAFKRIKRLAEKRNKNIWNQEIIKQYWTKNHNEIINQGDGMYRTASNQFKDLCKIHEAEVIQTNPQTNELRVVYNSNKTKKQRIVSSFLVPNIKVGDKIRIHFAFAVEKV